MGPGLLVLLGVVTGDGEAEAEKLARKTAALRIFDDANPQRVSRTLPRHGGGHPG
ncbi:MAG: D-aminoacyl-tRNA deacylase [Planctomycetota bacterium]